MMEEYIFFSTIKSQNIDTFVAAAAGRRDKCTRENEKSLKSITKSSNEYYYRILEYYQKGSCYPATLNRDYKNE